MKPSTVNSFSALGFGADEAVVEALRADLADIVRGFIERSQLTQKSLETTLGIPQSTISAIKNDRIDHLSVEYFVRILARAGIPWTAKCWKPPHDAMWVAGGMSQLVAQMNYQGADQSLVPVRDYWGLATDARLTNYTLAGTESATDSPITPASGKASA